MNQRLGPETQRGLGGRSGMSDWSINLSAWGRVRKEEGMDADLKTGGTE